MMGFGMINHITIPTRYAKKQTCLDLIFTKADNITEAGTIQYGPSDHDMVFVTSNVERCVNFH